MTTLPAPDDRHWLIKTVFLRKEKTIPSALLMAAVFVCNGLTPVIVGHAIDEAVTTRQISALVKWLVILCCTFALNMACGWFGRGLFNRAMLEVGHELRMAVTDRIQDPRGMAGPQHTAGELLSIASTDTQRIANAVIMTVFPVAEIASIVYAASMTAAVNIPLGIAMLAGGPIVVWLSIQGSKPLRRRSGRRQAALAAASATATDVVEGLRILKGLGAVDTVRQRYKHVSDTAYERTVDANAARARLNAQTETVGSVYVILIGVAAGWLALAGTVSVGQLITVIGLTQFIITPMTMLGKNIASRWANAQASSVRVTGILGADFAFDDANAAVPALEPGITVVSTPAPAELAQLPRHQITVAPHRADLFEGTVAGNVHADRERALVALHVAAAEDIPGGPDREVGENGKNLSGGQRQRVALARAIASDADVLVLQDPTTAVDSVTEQCIAERVARHRNGKATVVYTQAPAWRAVANDKAVDAELAWLSQGRGR